ncbi:MAG TPA: hypothetical protein VHQ47_11690 [Phycisphaerae bacterium]|nr:hypothetical protein [Phycisphaerae bacterium]
MPIKRIVRGTITPETERLLRELVAEWKNPSDDTSNPVILQEGGGKRPVHVYVVWEEWAGLDQLERSEIILEAFEEVKGKKAALEVTVAMGLTAREAERMGISYK